MADDCIRRSDVLNEIHRFRGYIDEDLEYRMKFEFNRIPSADVAEVKRGEWVNGECSVCGSWNLFDFDGYNCESNFCPNCGADMREANGLSLHGESGLKLVYEGGGHEDLAEEDEEETEEDE